MGGTHLPCLNRGLVRGQNLLWCDGGTGKRVSHADEALMHGSWAVFQALVCRHALCSSGFAAGGSKPRRGVGAYDAGQRGAPFAVALTNHSLLLSFRRGDQLLVSTSFFIKSTSCCMSGSSTASIVCTRGWERRGTP